MELLYFTKEATSSTTVIKPEEKIHRLYIKVVQALNFPVQDTTEISIRLGDGHHKLASGKCDLCA